MAFVDADEVEEVGRIVAKVRRRLAVLGRTAQERLEDREKKAAVLGDSALFANLVRLDPHHGIFRERGKGVIRLVGEDVSIGKE
jgi:hypothetical protein